MNFDMHDIMCIRVLEKGVGMRSMVEVLLFQILLYNCWEETMTIRVRNLDTYNHVECSCPPSGSKKIIIG